jgi:hypothetical protein
MGGDGNPPQGNGRPLGRGSEPLGGDGGPLGKSGPLNGGGPTWEVKEDFWLEAQMRLSMLPGQVILGTHGIHHWHPPPLWLLHQRNHYRTQFIMLGQI